MSRPLRLQLLEPLRGRRLPITAAWLAETLEVSERTIYRDVADLMAQGVPIEGEAGVGYILCPGLFLPPLIAVGRRSGGGDPGIAVCRSARRRGFAGRRWRRLGKDRLGHASSPGGD